MTSSLRAFLLITTAITLIACDDNSTTSTSSEDSYVPQLSDNIIGYYQPSYNITLKTTAGSFLAGQHAQMENDWKKAADYFEDVLQKDPDNEAIKRRVMALSIGAGNFDRAVAIAETLAETDKGESMAQLLLSLNDFKNGHYTEATGRINQISKDGISANIAPIIKAWSEAARGQYDPKILNDSPAFIYQNVLIADYLGDKNAIKALAKNYNMAHSSTPIVALESVADIFAKYGETDAARNIYTALQKIMKTDQGALADKIKNLSASNDQPVAKTDKTPQQGLAQALLDTAALLLNGYEDSSLMFAQMSLFLNPKNDNVYEILAETMAYNRNFDEAISYLGKIDTGKNPERAQLIQRQIAVYLQEDQKQDEAIRILSDMVDQYKNVDAQIQIGDIYRQQEDYKNALTAYNKAVDMLGKNMSAEYWPLLFSRGMTNERLKNWNQAEKDLTAALSYEPDQPYVLNYLGYSWADQGKNLDKAVEMIEKAARLRPTDGAIIDSLGWVYFRLGKYNEAVETLEQAVELQPYEPEINDHLGDAYWQVGRKNEARFQWKRALSFTKDTDTIGKIEQKIENGLPTSSLVLEKNGQEKIVANE